MDFFAFISANPVWLISGAGLIGLLIGSFLNVVILRLPPRVEWAWKKEASEFLTEEPFSEPSPPGLVVERSGCPKCGHPISWWENLPVLSFVLLRGKCRGCKAPISWQYPAVETLTSLLFIGAALAFGATPYLLAAWAFIGLLVAAAVIDLRTQFLFDDLVLPLLWLGLLVAAAGLPGAVSLQQAVFGAVAGYLSLWSVFWGFKLLTGKDGMGYGDFKLLAALGAWCGATAILPIVLISTIAGALIGGTALAIQGRDKATPFPFGPFLAVGGVVEFFWRGQLLSVIAGN